MILVAILDEIYTVGIAVLVYDLHYFINIMRPILITIDKVIETPPFKTKFLLRDDVVFLQLFLVVLAQFA